MVAATDGSTVGEKAAPLASLPVLRNVSLVYLLFALAAVAYWPASKALYEVWTDFRNLGDTHGFLVLGISLWLVFRSRRAINGTGERPSIVALIGLLLASFAWLILWRGGLQDPHLMLIPAILWLCILAAFGRNVAMALALPIGFLYFAWPGWAYLAPVLQALTTRAVGLLASAFGVPRLHRGQRGRHPRRYIRNRRRLQRYSFSRGWFGPGSVAGRTHRRSNSPAYETGSRHGAARDCLQLDSRIHDRDGRTLDQHAAFPDQRALHLRLGAVCNWRRYLHLDHRQARSRGSPANTHRLAREVPRPTGNRLHGCCSSDDDRTDPGAGAGGCRWPVSGSN